MTAEEFIREKIREKQGIKGQMYALWKYQVNGEDCLRWAHEYATQQLEAKDKEISELKNVIEDYQESVDDKVSQLAKLYARDKDSCL